VEGAVDADSLQLSGWANDIAAEQHPDLDRRQRHQPAARLHRLSAVTQTVLQMEAYAGHVFVFRGRRGDLIKLLWWDGDGLCRFAKRLERGRFVWPQAEEGAVSLSRAQLSMLLEGIDWRRPIRTSALALAA